MKKYYVQAVRWVRELLRRVGALALLDALARRTRGGAWLRSLLAIYDVEDLIALDTPWWTFESIDKVAEHLAHRPGATVFEWGSGASTAWLAKRAGRVVTIEHDRGWADQVRSLVPGRVQLVTVPATAARQGHGIRSKKLGHEGLDFTDYVGAIDTHAGKFDLIVIDGRAREACLRRALPRLAEDGLIVFDNVDRQRYRDAIAAASGVEVLVTRGLTPSLPYPTRTALIRTRSGT